MPSIVITIDGVGVTKQISASELYNRLIPAMRYMNVVTSWSDDDGVIHSPTDQDILKGWADEIITKLIHLVDVHDDATRVKSPLNIT